MNTITSQSCLMLESIYKNEAFTFLCVFFFDTYTKFLSTSTSKFSITKQQWPEIFTVDN